MAFASIHIPDFRIQAVTRFEPALRHGAVALVDGIPPQCKVVAASQAALQAGIQFGMAKSLAANFRAVEIRHRSPEQENASHAALLDLGWSVSPRVEDTAPDTVILDIDGLGSLFGSESDIANQLMQRASGLGLAANVAVAPNIEAAFLASRGFAGITLIPPGEESKCLGRLPVQVLPASPEILEILARWGIHTCGALAALPPLDLSERLGQEGVRLHEMASGAGRRSLVLAEPGLSFEEEMTLEDAVDDLEPLAFILGRLLDQLTARLAARSLAANSVRVQFVLDIASQIDRSRPQRNSSTVNPRDARHKKAGKKESSVLPTVSLPTTKTYKKVLTLPVPMRDSKLLLKLLRLQLESDPPLAPILKVALMAEAARPRVTQGGLFLPSFPDPEKLEVTVARLGNLVGASNIGSPELVDTHRPEAFRIRRFVPSRSASGKAIPSGNRRHAIGFRVFRPAPPARLELREGRPVRAFFCGMRGSVVAASGPWCTSGDWWREDTWKQEEWDLEILMEFSANSSFRHPISDEGSPPGRQRGVYCIFFDLIHQGWFVRGIYD